MRLLALLPLLASLLAPTTPYPEWSYYDCEPRAVVIVSWYDPPVGVGAMTHGLLYVWEGIHLDTETLHYNGWYLDVEGKLIHEWYAVYDTPASAFYLDAYVKNIDGVLFWLPETFAPPCFAAPRVWLPQVRR